MIEHYLYLLKNGYNISEIIDEINKAILISKMNSTLNSIINQLEQERLLAKIANMKMLETKINENKVSEASINPQETFVEPMMDDELNEQLKHK